MRDRNSMKHLSAPPKIALEKSAGYRNMKGEPRHGVVCYKRLMGKKSRPEWEGKEIPAGLINGRAESLDNHILRQQLTNRLDADIKYNTPGASEKTKTRKQFVIRSRLEFGVKFYTLETLGNLFGVNKQTIRVDEAQCLRVIRRSMGWWLRMPDEWRFDNEPRTMQSLWKG